ncbi:MAG: hypothetical protein ACRCZD_16425 [Phycicoccus sp.]
MTNSPEHPFPSPSQPSWATTSPIPAPPPAYPGGEPSYAASMPHQGWGAPWYRPVGSEDPEARRKAGTALGWAVAATVTAGLAVVLGVIVLVVFLSGGSYEPLRGDVGGLTAGAALSGDRLEEVVTDTQDEYGYVQERISCPDTSSVSASTAVVCTGRVDGFEWTGVVFFEDDSGAFVVLEL